jgi:hypothetical protein
VSPTAGEFFDRLDEVRRHIELHKKSLRALAEARCPSDGRLLGAVYQFPDGCWLWTVGERMAPEEMSREVLEMAVLEYEAAVEHGTGREEAWDSIVIPAGEGSPPGSQTWPSSVGPLGDPVECYRSHTFDQLVARLANGDFASCGRCRRTYVVDHAVMHYAAGLYLSSGRTRPVLLHPGRKVVAGSDPALERTQEYGLTHPWQLGPWTLDGMPSQ